MRNTLELELGVSGSVLHRVTIVAPKSSAWLDRSVLCAWASMGMHTSELVPIVSKWPPTVNLALEHAEEALSEYLESRQNKDITDLHFKHWS